MALYLPHEIWTSVTILSGLENFAGMAANLLIATMISFHRVSSGRGFSMWRMLSDGTVRMRFSTASSAQGAG